MKHLPRHGRFLLAAAVLAALPAVGCEPAPEPKTVRSSLDVRMSTRPWKTPYADGLLLESAHYRIYTTADRPMLRTYLPGYMEAAHRNYLELTGLPAREVERPMDLYMLGSRNEWAALTRHVVREQIDLYLSIQAGGYCYEGVCVFWDIGPHTLSIAAHEGLHQFFDRRLKDPLPMWAEEGLCVTAEGFELQGESVRFTPERNLSRFQTLREVIGGGRWIAADALLAMDAGDAVAHNPYTAVGYYAQLWALVHFLRSRPEHRAGLERMLQDAEAGRFARTIGPDLARLRGRAFSRAAGRKLFETYITADIAGFDREFYAHAKNLAKLH